MIFLTQEEDIDLNKSLQSLYFYASWMPFHKKILVMIGKIEEKYKANFLAIDIDNFGNLCNRFKIDSVPTILVFQEGKELKRIEGICLTSAFKSVYADIYSKKKGNDNA